MNPVKDIKQSTVGFRIFFKCSYTTSHRRRLFCEKLRLQEEVTSSADGLSKHHCYDRRPRPVFILNIRRQPVRLSSCTRMRSLFRFSVLPLFHANVRLPFLCLHNKQITQEKALLQPNLGSW